MTTLEKETMTRGVEDVEVGEGNDKIVDDVTSAALVKVPTGSASEPLAGQVVDGGLRAWLQVLGCFFLVSRGEFLEMPHSTET